MAHELEVVEEEFSAGDRVILQGFGPGYGSLDGTEGSVLRRYGASIPGPRRYLVDLGVAGSIVADEGNLRKAGRWGLGSRVTVIKLEDDVMGVNGTRGRIAGYHVEEPDYYVVDLNNGLAMVLHADEMLVSERPVGPDGEPLGRHAEAVARSMMSAMGCHIQEDEPDCDHDGLCGGHGQFSYCTVHDWEEDWMDWDRGTLCLYAVGLAVKVAGDSRLDPWWDSVKVAMEARRHG